MKLALHFFAPAELRLDPQRGSLLERDWPWLAHWTSCPGVEPDKSSCGGITFARLRDGVRRKAHVESVTALVIDHDAGDVRPSWAHEALARYRHVIHSTAQHTPDAPRWRAMIALSREVTGDEHAKLWTWARDVLRHGGIAIDPSAKDSCRLWYCPTIRAFSATFEHFATLDAAPLDVDAVLARAATRIAPRAIISPPAPEHRDRYIAGALRRAALAVAQSTPGERHGTLNAEAYALARLGLGLSEISDALAPAWLATAGEARLSEGVRTIADAVRARGAA